MLQAVGAGNNIRLLVHIPIIHTEADLGSVARSVRSLKVSAAGRGGFSRQARMVERMWDDIERTVAALPAVPQKIYQDGLPVCGHEPLIVRELAEAGSRNHRLLMRLADGGAVLMGTESPELLIEEYQFATATLVPGGIHGGPDASARNGALGASLLERRDKFIATRINETLAPGEQGLLFLGMLHTIEPLLAADIAVVHPLGAPRPTRAGKG